MAEKTGNGDTWQPMTGADSARIKHLGALLKLRRAELGHRYLPPFVRDRRINTRMVGDIEHGRRDTFTFPSLQDVARAYEVTYDSMMAVVWSGAGELAPVRADPPPDENTPPLTQRQVAAGQSWYDEINEIRVALAARGITNPTGAQMFPGDPDDARAWDEHDYYSVKDRVHFIAEVRRQVAGRVPNSGTGTAGA